MSEPIRVTEEQLRGVFGTRCANPDQCPAWRAAAGLVEPCPERVRAMDRPNPYLSEELREKLERSVTGAPDPAPARRSLPARILAAIDAVAAAVAQLFEPPRCDCGAELRVHGVWYPPAFMLEPMPVYLWHCPACDPLEAREPA